MLGQYENHLTVLETEEYLIQYQDIIRSSIHVINE